MSGKKVRVSHMSTLPFNVNVQQNEGGRIIVPRSVLAGTVWTPNELREMRVKNREGILRPTQ